MHADISHLADRLVALRFREEPLEAVLLGLAPTGHALADLSAQEAQDLADDYASMGAAAQDLAEARAGAPDADEADLLVLDLIRLTANAMVDSLYVPWVEFTVTDLFNAPLSGLISVMYQLPLDTPERRGGHLARLAAVPSFLAQAAQRHREGVAAGRTTTARGARGAIAQIDKVLADPALSGLRRLAPDDAGPEFASEQDRLIEDAVKPAIVSYRDCLEHEVLATGRPDEQPGLCWLPDGEEMYRHLVRASTSTDRTPEDLHATGLAIIESLNAEFAKLGERLWGTRDVAAIHERLRSDPALRYESAEEIMATAVEAVHRAEAAAPGWFGLVATTPCVVASIPEALADGSPPAYYFTGALDGSRPGTYFVNTTQPGKRFRQLAEAVAFHEAVPGHHFQLTIAQDTSQHLAQSVFGNVATAEGWGLYAERLADEMGLYSSDLGRLGMVSTDAWRAARLVVDTGLHALGWTRQATIDWMSAHVPMSPVEIESEVDRYIAMPGQALSYMVGRLEIERFRAEAAERLGDAFDVRTFHDAVLRAGPVPLPALSAALDRWITAQA